MRNILARASICELWVAALTAFSIMHCTDRDNTEIERWNKILYRLLQDLD